MGAIRTFINTYQVYFAIGICVFAFGFGWYCHTVWTGYNENKKLNAEIAERIEIENTYKTKAQEYETEIAALKKAADDRKLEEKNEVRKNPTYTSCNLVASSVRLSNKAIAAANATSKPD